MNQVRGFIAEVGAARAAIIGGAAAVVLVILVALAMRGGSGPMAYLYTDLDPASASAITDRLTSEGVPYDLAAGGGAIMVPEARVADLRMRLAGDHMGGPLGYEIIDREDAFGTSAAKAKINRTRAIEGELARSIETITTISRARVHVNLPERALFSRETQAPSASVTLRAIGQISAGQVDAIRALVSSAVPGLDPQAISVVDQSGALLARAGDNEGAAALDGRQAAIEKRLGADVEALVGRIVGMGAVRANVSATLEQDDIREEAELYDPERAVMARQTTVERADEDSELSALGGAVSISTSLPDATTEPADQEQRRRRANETSEEMVWANSATRTTRVRQNGAIERLTVSVVVDGTYENGSYQPRTATELDRLTALVENAVGFDEARGDRVMVENLRFAPVDGIEPPIAGLPMGLTKTDILPILRSAILGIIGIVALTMILKSVKGGAVTRMPTLPSLTPESDQARMQRLLERASAGDDDALTELQALRGEHRAPVEQEIDLAQIEGRLKTTAVRKVGEVVERSPREASAIIRQWMYS
ncbi:MAG: flagellar basal-body MS-ring/collar protein FliF [Pseudomonadota bacterium]